MSDTTKKEKLNPQQWVLLKNIVADAMEESSPAARTELVENQCAGDKRLMAEAELLLKEGEALLQEPTDAMEECAEHATAALWQDESRASGSRIGAYVIIRELARGGMGTVYLADRADGQFEKRVAIKVLKRGTDTEEVLRRFSAERHILARLDHPNIAQLLDAGTTDDGLPYFVMEYVGGSPVTRFVRAENFSVQERLALFLKIASAVAFAHRRQIIHRDLKSTNILVTEDAEPKLLDFGIAKLLGPSDNFLETTAAGEGRLTLTCASPEQVDGGRITQATDVYALGGLLYELLCREKPHKFSSTHPSRQEIRRIICDQNPPLPSSVVRSKETARLLRGNLDAIVAYAMRKEPQLRYATVAEFAEDIRRHLAYEPVRARRGTASYRAKSFVIRHRRLIAGFATAMLLVLLGALANHWSGTQRLVPDGLSVQSKSIAVLPFDNFGDKSSPTYFVDGVQDNILTDLSKVSDLRVISRRAVEPYRGKSRNVKEIGRALGVANVLAGSVQVSGDRVRINAQLIDTRSDTQVWAEHYDRKMEDILSLQSELARTIVAQLKATLTSEEKSTISRRPTENLQAYNLYMQARELFDGMRGLNPTPNWKQARELAQKAIELDNTFTRAYCLLNSIDLMTYRFGNDHTPERLTEAKESAEIALRTDPQSEEAQLALARYYYNGLNDYPRTEEQLLRIRSSTPHTVSYYEMASLVGRRLGKWQDSIRNGEKAIELDPQNSELIVSLIQTYNGLRRYQDSIREVQIAFARLSHPTPRLALVDCEAAVGLGDLASARGALSRFPNADSIDYQIQRIFLALLERNYVDARQFASRADDETTKTSTYWLIMAAIAKAEGKSDEQRSYYLQAKSLAQAALTKRTNDPVLLGELAAAKAMLGETEEALTLAKHAVELWPEQVDALVAPNCEMYLAIVLDVAGQRDAAFEILNHLARCPFGVIHGDLKLNPMWDSFRDDPRFEQIIAASAQPIAIDK